MAFDRGIFLSPPSRLWSNPEIEWMRLPLLPQQIIMTDRGDGSLWLLSHNTTDSPPSDGFGRISINSTFSTGFGDYEIFGPYDGPLVAGPRDDFLLLIRDGRLGYEVRPDGFALAQDHNLRVLTRKGTVRESREINVPSTWTAETDVLGWSPVEI